MSNKIKKHEGTTEFEGVSIAEADIECSLAKNFEGTGVKFHFNAVNPMDIKPTQVAPLKIARPTYLTHDDWVNIDGSDLRPGLYYHGLDKENNPFNIWICTPIHTIAQTCNEYGTAWGLLLKFMNPDGKWTEWAMPSYMLKGAGEEIRGELLNMGVKIAPDGNKQLHHW